MKKIFLITITCVVLLSSCSHNNNPSVSYGDSYEVLHYNGVNYVLFSESAYFHPFLADPYSISKDEYVIEDNYFADKKDTNLCFIYSRGGILRDLVYIKEGVSIPDRITTFNYVDAVVIATPYGYYYIDNRENINLLIDFFNSKEVIEMESLQPVEVDSSKAINIYAISNYYGGIFSLNRGYGVFSEKGKYIIGVENKEFIFPDNINNIINQKIGN